MYSKRLKYVTLVLEYTASSIHTPDPLPLVCLQSGNKWHSLHSRFSSHPFRLRTKHSRAASYPILAGTMLRAAKVEKSSSNMLKINYLLNPSASPELAHSASPSPAFATSPPWSPAYTPALSPSPVIAGGEASDGRSPAKRTKLVKDAPVFIPGEVRAQVNYPPFELNEIPVCLSASQHDELVREHKRFQVYPNGDNTGDQPGMLIGSCPKAIPYSSEKKDLLNKTGLEGFNGECELKYLLPRVYALTEAVYQYTFILPDDPKQKKYAVLWDYNNGLVRITPFFKACGHTKVCTCRLSSPHISSLG